MSILGDKVREIMPGIDLYATPAWTSTPPEVFRRRLKTRVYSVSFFCNFKPKLVDDNGTSFTVVSLKHRKGWFITSTRASTTIENTTPFDTVEDAVAAALLTYNREREK